MTTSTATRTRAPRKTAAKTPPEPVATEEVAAEVVPEVTETPPPVKKPAARRARTTPADHAAQTVDTARKAAARVKASPVAPPASRAQLRAVPSLPSAKPRQTRQEKLDSDLLQEAVEAMTDAVIFCRSMSHHWVPQNAIPEKGGYVIVITTRCDSCESIREQFIGSRTGELVAPTQIKYSKGYLLAPGVGGDNSSPGVARGFSRLAMISRMRKAS